GVQEIAACGLDGFTVRPPNAFADLRPRALLAMTVAELSAVPNVASALLAGLSEGQRRAASFGLDGASAPGAPGPLLIVAGAGTGKTLTLAARVARLVLAGTDP